MPGNGAVLVQRDICKEKILVIGYPRISSLYGTSRYNSL